MTLARADGRVLAYEVVGTGRPVVVLPGGPGGSGRLYRDRLSPLSKGAQLVFWDYRGCGGSERATEYSMAADLADLDTVIERLELDRPVLLGHSYGGMLAMRYALDHPDRLGGLVLVATVPSAKAVYTAVARKGERLGPNERKRWEELSRLCARSCDANEAAEYLRLDLSTQIVERRFLDEVASQFEISFEVITALQADMQAFDVEARLGQVKVPTLLVSGAHDPIGPGASKRIHAAISGSTHVELEHSGHWPFVEEHARFIDVVASWLAS